jgi:hypothetical protein
MIHLVALLAITVVPVNDPLAPLQLIHADVTPQRDTLRVCVRVRNESPQTVGHVISWGPSMNRTGAADSSPQLRR